jgi:hypothetical protein
MHPKSITSPVCETCGRSFEGRSGKPNRFCSRACKDAPRPLVRNEADPGTYIVPLTRGMVAVIDADDFILVAPYRWSAIKIGDRWYATRSRRVDEGRGIVMMHQQIMGDVPGGMMIDHEDLDGLNNRRSNLRVASKAENMANRTAQQNNSNGWKGVHWSSRRNRWIAQICHERQRRFIGHFHTAEDAARAYDEAARELHGEFARLNFPDAAAA